AEQSDQQNAEEFTQSLESAKVAAFRQLDIPVGSQTVVASVVKDAPADGKLHAGDVIKAVDGTAIKANTDVAKLVTKHKPGERAV
ncbi:PDZ domain-containing protein, partial [Microbacterium sp. ZXX196]